MKRYASTATLCEMYDLGDDFFHRRIKDGTFVRNEHYVQRGQTIRWDVDAIEQWWRGDAEPDSSVDDVLSRVLPEAS